LKNGLFSAAGQESAGGHEAPALRVRLGRAKPASGAPGKQFAQRCMRAVRAAGLKGVTRQAKAPSRHHAGRAAGVRGRTGQYAQRVVIKARICPTRNGGAKAMRRHLDYIQRDGVGKETIEAKPFGPEGKLSREDMAAFAERSDSDRHSFRLIISPENGKAMDMETHARDLLARMEHDLGTKLDYVAVAHYNTDEPHVHVVIRGKDDRGGDLVMSRDYISNGIRARASDLATQELGYRNDLDVVRSLAKDLQAERMTALDRRLLNDIARHPDGVVDLRQVPASAMQRAQRDLKLGRLGRLKAMGLATELAPGRWQLDPEAETKLRGMAQEGQVASILRPHAEAERALAQAIVSKDTLEEPVKGVVLDRGLANELSGSEYVVVGGFDGKLHYANIGVHAERHMPEHAKVGDVVELGVYRPPVAGAADRNMVAMSEAGIYDPAKHLATVSEWPEERLPPGVTPEAYVEAHVARAEALVSRGHLARLEQGHYAVPADLVERVNNDPAMGRDRPAFLRLDVHGRGPMPAQAQAIGYTYFDRQIEAGELARLEASRPHSRSQAALTEALRARTDRLVELGVATRNGAAITFAADWRQRLRGMELDDAARRLSARYGTYANLDTARQFSGRLEGFEALPSGIHAVIVKDDTFTLVPASRGLQKLAGQDVMVSLRGRDSLVQAPDPQQVRVRFATLDALRKGRDLGIQL
jgi:type IV secretory pathway VirD2 relaxase